MRGSATSAASCITAALPRWGTGMAASAVVPHSSSWEVLIWAFGWRGQAVISEGGSLPCTATAVGAPKCPDTSPCAEVLECERMCTSSVCPDYGWAWGWCEGKKWAWGEHGRQVKRCSWATVSDAGERAVEMDYVSVWMNVTGGWGRRGQGHIFFPRTCMAWRRTRNRCYQHPSYLQRQLSRLSLKCPAIIFSQRLSLPEHTLGPKFIFSHWKILTHMV